MLPIVLILGLIAYGAWYAIRELKGLQTQLIDAERQRSKAEIEKAKAEADAESAAAKARYDVLLETQKQLTNLNTVSADVSKRLQELVSKQLENMKENTDLSQDQEKRARGLQDQIDQAKNAQLDNLQKQIAEAQQKSDALTRTAGLDGYKAIKDLLATTLRQGGYPDQLLASLETRLDDSTARDQALKDANNTGEYWEVRSAINLLLFQKTGNTAFWDSFRKLVEQNGRFLSRSTSSLFAGPYLLADKQHAAPALDLAVALFDDGNLSSDVRDWIFFQMFSFNSPWSEMLTNTQRTRVARFAGTRILEIGRGDPTGCFQMYTFTNALHQLEPDAQLVYATKALQTTPRDSYCASTLQQAIAGRSPTPEMIQRWDSGSNTLSSASGH